MKIIRKYYIIFISLPLFLLGACSPFMYTPTADMVKENITIESLIEGRSLYMSKCGDCHRLHSPLEFSQTEWRKNVEAMQPKAHISNDEKELIFNYLVNAPEKKPQ